MKQQAVDAAAVLIIAAARAAMGRAAVDNCLVDLLADNLKNDVTLDDIRAILVRIGERKT